jgi:hypothetical protein
LLWSGSANGVLAQWNLGSTEDQALIQQRKINMAKLNWLEVWATDNGLHSHTLAAAGVTAANEGAIHLYDMTQ